ncbi:hypothetical protein [Embleya sp. NPDC001921]
MPASSAIDLFDDSILADPYPAYATPRGLGPVVRLEAHGVWALPHHATVAGALRDPATYSSDHGVALTDEVNNRFLFGSAGRDRGKWGPRADAFDITRGDSPDQLSLGLGTHQCAGNHLAGLEFDAVLTALTTRFRTLSPGPDRSPIRHPHNILRGWHTLPLTAA